MQFYSIIPGVVSISTDDTSKMTCRVLADTSNYCPMKNISPLFTSPFSKVLACFEAAAGICVLAPPPPPFVHQILNRI